ncbi:MAG: hypothetical protein ACI4I6_07645 [Hominimerdicola sp.]
MNDRAVLFSIKPKYCELIASGKKTIEVRKTKPKIETPFKGYIYETKGLYKGSGNCLFRGSGKVIGEFVCDNIIKFSADKKADNIKLSNMAILSCLNCSDIEKYAGDKYYIYGFHISDLVIYNKPKELSNFYRFCGDNPKCKKCEWLTADISKHGEIYQTCGSKYEGMKPLYNDRPPQSWCYVQEVRYNA